MGAELGMESRTVGAKLGGTESRDLPWRGVVWFVALAIAVGCGSRSGLGEGEPLRDAGTFDADRLRDAAFDARVDAPTSDAGTAPCRWEPARRDGALVPPRRVELPREILATDVQLVAYDRGFFFLVPGTPDRDTLASPVAYGRLDDVVGAEPELWEGSRLIGVVESGLARHGSTSSYGILCNAGLVPRPDDGRLGFVFSDPCLGFVSGGDRAFAWLARSSGESQIAELRIVERNELVETFHDVATVFPPELLGATFDPRERRAVFLVGEIRGAASIDRLYVAEPGAARVRAAALPAADGFRRLVDLVALPSGELASIDLADVPVLHVFDVDGIARDERPASLDFFARGRPDDADLAAYEEGVLANVGGVIVDFARDGARLVVDELVASDASARGFDVALHGRHAVTATAHVEGERSAVILRHYECR